MDYYKKLFTTFKTIVSSKINLLVFIVLLLYFYTRSTTFAVFIFVVFFAHVFSKMLRSFPIMAHALKWLALCIILLLGLVSYFYTRYISWDGQLWYIRHVLLLTDDLFLHFTDRAYLPYITELFLAFINRALGFNFVTLFLFLISLINVYLLTVFYKALGYKGEHRLLAFFVIATPVFLANALFEFKVEHFLLCFALLSFIMYIKFEKTTSLLSAFLFGLFSGIAILIKIVVLPFYVALLFFIFLHFVLKKNYKKLIYLFLSAAFMLLPLCLWTLFYGLKVPWTTLDIYPIGHAPTVNFQKDNSIYLKCLQEQKVVDYSQFIADNSFLDVLLQPFNYLMQRGSLFGSLGGVGFIDPGLFMFMSFFIFLPAVLLLPRYRSSPLYLATASFVLIYFIVIRTVFWYLFFIFPILIIPFFELVISNPKLHKLLLSLIINLNITYIVLAMFFEVYVLIAVIPNDYSITGIIGRNIELSTFLNNTNGLIMDATAFPDQAFLTFVKDYDMRVVRDSLYFGYTDRTLESMHSELLQNKIKYIIVNPVKPVETLNFFGCPLVHQQIAQQFVSVYAKPIFYIAGTPLVYELKTD